MNIISSNLSKIKLVPFFKYIFLKNKLETTMCIDTEKIIV